VWEYYFEPIGGLTIDDARELISRTGRRMLTLTYEELWRLHHYEPKSVFTYPYGYFRDIVDKSQRLDSRWWRVQRARGRRLVSQYVRVKPDILAKADEFAAQTFGPEMLGIHMRGTDKGDTGTGARLARIVPPSEYFPLIDAYRKEHPSAGIFLATDQVQFRKQLLDRYGELVAWRAAALSDSNVNVFQVQRPGGEGNRMKGEEVLVDALLLSKCSYLLKCTSAVGEFAQYFAQTLDSTDLNFLHPAEYEPSALARALSGVRSLRKRVPLAIQRVRNEIRGRTLEDADNPTPPARLVDTNHFVHEP
jgi:hypothetical protein